MYGAGKIAAGLLICNKVQQFVSRSFCSSFILSSLSPSSLGSRKLLTTMENMCPIPPMTFLRKAHNALREKNTCGSSSAALSSVEKHQLIEEPQQERQFLVAIEGNIGAGKSTLMQYLSKFGDVDVCLEPVEDWCNVKGTNMLELLYKDPRRWCFAFNSNAMLARMKMHCDDTSSRAIRIIERSLLATRHVFVEQSLQAGHIEPVELALLDELFTSLRRYCRVHLDRIVYLRASPEVCLERIRRRGRKEEAGLSLEFLQSLHELYDAWLLDKDSSRSGDDIPVVTIDANDNVLDHYDEIYASVCLSPACQAVPPLSSAQQAEGVFSSNNSI